MTEAIGKGRRGARREVVTLRDIAEVAGVSAQTVSCVVNDNGSISGPIREKIRKIAADLGYLPNLSAKAMRTGRSQTIGLVISDIRVPFFPEFAYEVQRAALKHRYSVLIVDTGNSSGQMRERIATLQAMSVAGVITTEIRSGPLRPSAAHGHGGFTEARIRSGDVGRRRRRRDARGSSFVSRPSPNRVGDQSEVDCIPERREALLQRLSGQAKVMWEIVTPAWRLSPRKFEKGFAPSM